jgi:tetratricopeptide (TPR) repeat protein
MWLGFVQMYTKRVPQGVAECEHALALDRNLAVAHSFIGWAKYLLGYAAETEHHVREALRLSPRDSLAFQWMMMVGTANLQLNADAEAVFWYRRSLDENRNNPMAHFLLAAALAQLGELAQAQAMVQAGLALDPSFTVRRLIDVTEARELSNPAHLAGLKHTVEGLRLAGAPEG